MHLKINKEAQFTSSLPSSFDSNLDSKTSDTLLFCVIYSEHLEDDLSAKRTPEDASGQLG
jgi:hypothetical protein